MKSKGIILLGHPRSGTTLSRRLLNGHSNIASPPETHLFSACSRFLESERTSSGVDIGALSGLNFAGIKDDVVLEKLRQFAFSFLDDYAAREGKLRWAEKTAFDAFHIQNVEKLIREHAFYIGIVRHPLDVAISSINFCDSLGFYPKEMHKYISQYQYPIEAFTRSWLEVCEDLIELKEKYPDNCRIFRYEDLVSNPQATLTDILSFVGETYEENILIDSLSSDTSLGFGDHKSYQTSKVHSESVGKWHKIPNYQRQLVAPLVNPMLEYFNYPTIEENEEVSIDESRQQYLKGLSIVSKGHINRKQNVDKVKFDVSNEVKHVSGLEKESSFLNCIYGIKTSSRIKNIRQ